MVGEKEIQKPDRNRTHHRRSKHHVHTQTTHYKTQKKTKESENTQHQKLLSMKERNNSLLISIDTHSPIAILTTDEKLLKSTEMQKEHANTKT